MKKSILAISSLYSLICLSADETKLNTIDVSYTFTKISPGVSYTQSTDGSITTTKYRSYNLGSQITVGYTKKAVMSDYFFVGKITGLHSHYKFGSNNLPSEGIPGSKYERHQFNFFGTELAGRADLKSTKHATFSVQGGGIAACYFTKSHIQAAYDTFVEPYNPKRFYEFSTNYLSNYFVGPNIKAIANAFFFKRHLSFGLKAGIGGMMDFYSSKSKTSNKDYSYNTGAESSYAQKDHLKNRFKFLPQADLEASMTLAYKDFMLTGGLNQFFLMLDISGDEIRTLTFGGPFIKLSYLF
jgi:hypothetical protein